MHEENYMRVTLVTDIKDSWYLKKVLGMKQTIEKKQPVSLCRLVHTQSNINEFSDITFFLSCGEFVTQETRAKSKYNVVAHASDLPKGRGWAPATWQILEGKNEIPVTLFEVADGFDTGDWYLKDSFVLDGTELVDEWREKLYQCIERMALTFINQVAEGSAVAKKQEGTPTTYPRRRPKDSELDPTKTIAEQFNLLRVVDNECYPAFFFHKGQKYVLKIEKAQ